MHFSISELWEKQYKSFLYSMEQKLTIFIADDSKTICSVISDHLIKNGFNVEVFYNIGDMEKRLSEKQPDVILLDYYFENTTSLDFIINNAKRLPIMCMSSTENSEDINHIFSYEIVDFIPKPLHLDIIRLKINNFIKRIVQLRDFDNIELFLESLLYTVELKDVYTRGHSERVSKISELIASHLKLDSEKIELIRRGALLHDIGKIGVKDTVLLKTGRLTDEEFDEIKNHTTYGYNICSKLLTFEPYLKIIRNHHEKLNGSGYPDGLKYDEIPIEVQIVSVSDVFDALTSRRVYRDALSNETAYDILFEEYKKGFWDIELITALRDISGKI